MIFVRTEDVSLGPPKTMFPSSRNVSRLSDMPDRNATTGGDAGDEPESARSRFFSDRQLNRRSMNNEKEGRDNRDSWTSARERREKQDREDGDRRNGFGERQDPRWSRDDRRNGDRAGGWREREQQRRDREHDRAEKEPEWMDDPVVKKDQELGFGMARTQEEFQKWKESMGKKTKGEPEKEEEPVQAQPAPAAPTPAAETKPTVAPLKLDGFEGGMFGGGWAGANATAGSQGATTPVATGTIKSTTGKPKASRFASMFKPAADETPPPPAEEPSSQQPANGSTKKTTAEDQEGFNRVLQMLGSAKLGQPTPPSAEQTPASPPPSIKTAGMNGTAPGKPKSRFTDMFAQKSPERLQSPQQGGVQLGDSMFGSEANGPSNNFGGRLPERQVSEQQIPRSAAPESTMSPGPSGIPFNALREQQPRPASGRMNDMAMFEPPSRGTASPDVNIQNLLAQNRQRHHGQNSESQQLLNLLRKDTSSSRPPSQAAIPNIGGIDQAQLQHWLENQQRSQMPTEPHAPKPRVPQQPPGLFEEQLMRNYPTEQQQRQEHQMPPGMQEPQRRSSQRAPPGFFDEQTIFLQQQQQQQMRRQFAEGPPPQQQMPGAGRRPSGHPSLPQMQIPQGQQFPPSDFHQLTSPVGAQGLPPPGFNPHMPRHPPGFHNINIFQQPQQREPPPPGFGGMQSPPANAPPGFFGPQGVPPGFQMQAQQMRSPTDGMPPGRGRGFDGFDPSIAMGPRR